MTNILAREFIKRGHNVLFLNNKPDENLKEYAYAAPVYFFPDVEYTSPNNHSFFHTFLREHKVDFVINQCGNFGDSSLYLDVPEGVKTISVLHLNPLLNYDHLFYEISKLKGSDMMAHCKRIARILIYPSLKKALLKNCRHQIDYLSKHSDSICLLSPSFKDEIEFLCSPANKDLAFEKLHSIANPNTYEIEPEALNKKEKILLYVGRLDRGQKRPDRLLKIWKRIYAEFPDWSLVIVGDGEQREELERKAKKLPRVKLLGFQNPEEWYRKASIFCMTSNFEGWGMVLTEAMAFGTIPFAFDSYASAKDIISNGENGFLIPPFSIKTYAETLKRVMADEVLRHKIGERSIQSVKRFSKSNIEREWENLFNILKK